MSWEVSLAAELRALFLLALFICSTTSAARGESPPEGWIADALGCRVVNPQPQAVESITWSGSCRNGYAEGDGTVRWFSAGRSNGMTSGMFKAGKLVGKGTITLPQAVYRADAGASRNVELRRGWPSGSRLDGEFLDNRLMGDGTMTLPGGQKVVVVQIDGKLIRKSAVAATRGGR